MDAADLNLLTVTDSPEEAVDVIRACCPPRVKEWIRAPRPRKALREPRIA